MPEKSQAPTFDPTSIPGLSNKAREAVTSVFEAMTAWQSETAEVGEKNSKQVFDRMATAAAALGWPEQIVDAARAQMQGVGDIQAKTMEHIRSLGRATQEPHGRFARGDAVQAKVDARLRVSE